MGDTTASWNAPQDWERVLTVDAHAEGEPLRVIMSGFPQPEGTTVLERRQHARAHLDRYRSALMWEPRGHADMYGCLVMPPVTPEADFAVLFIHNEGFSTMCGHGIIGVCTVLLETGYLPAPEPEASVAIDTPAGLVRARATVDRGRVRDVRFVNVPSFAAALGEQVNVPALGTVTYDLGYGGAFYAFVGAAGLRLELGPPNVEAIIHAGRAIKGAVAAKQEIVHPEEPDLGFLYGTIFTGPASDPQHHSRHACVFADGEVDRSPTGTGVSARLAILHARGELATREEITIESLIGTRFSGRITAHTQVGEHDAVVPEVGGRAFLTGRHEFFLDPEDPLRDGFLVR
jgi:trans-L-3-hydroxyproline dehydratase